MEPAATFRPQVDSLRAFAVSGVLLAHFAAVPQVGHLGVRCFFIISGLLITRILLEIREDAGEWPKRRVFKSFYARRALRIFPAYFVVLAASTVVGSQTASNPLPHTLGWHILFLSNWLFVLTGQWHDLTAHLWTISVEEQFYLVWPFLILLAPYSFLRPLMVTVMLSAIAFRFWYVDIGDPEVGIWAITPASFDALALGGLIGIWRHEGGSMPTGWIVLVLLVTIPIMAFVTARQSNEAYYVFSETLWLVPLGLAVVGAHIGYGGFVGRMLELRPLLALGRISYGVYLWHVLCAAIVFEAVARTTGVRVELGILYFLIASSASVAVAALSYRFIEMPAMKHKVRFPYRGPAQG